MGNILRARLGVVLQTATPDKYKNQIIHCLLIARDEDRELFHKSKLWLNNNNHKDILLKDPINSFEDLSNVPLIHESMDYEYYSDILYKLDVIGRVYTWANVKNSKFDPLVISTSSTWPGNDSVRKEIATYQAKENINKYLIGDDYVQVFAG